MKNSNHADIGEIIDIYKNGCDNIKTSLKYMFMLWTTPSMSFGSSNNTWIEVSSAD